MKNAATVPSAPKSTPTSKVTGTNAGMELKGFPPMSTAQSTAEVHHMNSMMRPAPANAPIAHAHPSRLGSCSEKLGEL